MGLSIVYLESKEQITGLEKRALVGEQQGTQLDHLKVQVEVLLERQLEF